MKAIPKAKSTSLESSSSDCIQPAETSLPAISLPIEPNNTGAIGQPSTEPHNAEIWDNTGDWRSGPDGFFD
jgi:hypothetical protein